MIAKTIERVVAKPSNSLGKPWDPVWVPHHDGVDSTSPIGLYKGGIRSKYPTKEALGLSCNSGRALLERASFSRWDDDGTPKEKLRNVNVQFLINGTP